MAPLPPGQSMPTSQQIGLAPHLTQPSLAPQRPSVINTAEETIGGQTWSYDSGLGVVEPRSASQVLSTLAGKVAQGDVTQYQPMPLGFTPLDKSIGGGIRAGELLPHRRRPGNRQDDDGAPDGAEHRHGRPRERPLHLLRARRGVPPQPHHRQGIGAAQPAQSGRRREAGRRPAGDPGHLDGDRRPERQPRSQPAPAAGPRARQPLRAEPVSASWLADHVDDREHERARGALQAALRATGGSSSSSTTCRRCPSTRSRPTRSRR